MKYMGSKRSMLKNGLGKLLSENITGFTRFVDLFSGSGNVSWFVAERFSIPVFSVDLQNYSSILAKSVITRTNQLDYEQIFLNWKKNAKSERSSTTQYKAAIRLQNRSYVISKYVERARILCNDFSSLGPIWNAYGGYYFSPVQAITFDSLLQTLPENPIERIVCLAACISAASECAASPGHTAQPFQPTEKAGKYIIESWDIDPFEKIFNNLQVICSKKANVIGNAIISDAQIVASTLSRNDLVFIDPPYSNVQYSRFYHVLETISRETEHVEVTGKGRYPIIAERPQSKFSNVSQSREALQQLLEILANQGSTIIFTFPTGESSNGLSGNLIQEIANEWFYVDDRNAIEGQFSTLGGNNENRSARNLSKELVLLLTPR